MEMIEKEHRKTKSELLINIRKARQTQRSFLHNAYTKTSIKHKAYIYPLFVPEIAFLHNPLYLTHFCL